APGRVVRVSQLGTYGLTVIVEHGGGDYSIYGSLARSDVAQGQSVTKGQVIGGVGISDPELPPHLHFEIRHGGPAVDPAIWLRQRCSRSAARSADVFDTTRRTMSSAWSADTMRSRANAPVVGPTTTRARKVISGRACS